MKIIVGVVVKKDNKILMIQEANKKAYKKWNIPGGNLQEKEDLFLAAKREFKEETGYDVELENIISIYNKTTSDQTVITIRFYGKIVGGKLAFNKKESLNVDWIPIERIKNMSQDEIRNYDINMDTIKKVELNISYPLNIIKNI